MAILRHMYGYVSIASGDRHSRKGTNDVDWKSNPL